jgi:glyoxylase-like metal-dependent hydrolase (beta-lactamase superfamily II)
VAVNLRRRWTLVLAVGLTLVSQPSASAHAAEPSIKLWRLDCGTIEEGDPLPSPWFQRPVPVPCFLVQHGTSYLLWDAGLSARALGNQHPRLKLNRTISDQLRQIGVRSEQVGFVGISHNHGDHTGQAMQFPQAKLLIGVGDFEALKSATPPPGTAPTHIQAWVDGKAPVEALREDKDVFGDGSVMVLMTPGHTPGHSSLLVKLKSGAVILSGDLWWTHTDALRARVPDFNTSRAETLASRDRISRMADKLDATIILQHELRDVELLPVFPKAAE